MEDRHPGLPSRRSVLAAAAAGIAGLGLGLSSDMSSQPPVPVADRSTVTFEQEYSQSRNRIVNLVTMYPKDVDREGLPVCLMLHGRFGDARKSAGGLPTWLSESVAAGRVPPFAFLAVDGGANSYWHRWPGDDPLTMLLDEVPQWLTERSLAGPDGLPFAASGISMGGFGALLYARRRHQRRQPLSAAAVVSPALLTNWPEMRKRRAFANEAEWAAMDPLRHTDALGDLPVGIWCGTEDRFIEGTRRYIQTADPAYASTSPGGHNSRYYRKALPEVVDFVGAHLTGSYSRRPRKRG